VVVSWFHGICVTPTPKLAALINRSTPSSIITRGRAQQQNSASSADAPGYKELSPAAFRAYRESRGHVDRPPVNVLHLSSTKSPASTIGSSLLESTVQEESQESPVSPVLLDSTDSPNVHDAGDKAGDANDGASSTESALLDLFNSGNNEQPTTTKPLSNKKKRNNVPNHLLHC